MCVCVCIGGGQLRAINKIRAIAPDQICTLSSETIRGRAGMTIYLIIPKTARGFGVLTRRDYMLRNLFTALFVQRVFLLRNLYALLLKYCNLFRKLLKN